MLQHRLGPRGTRQGRAADQQVGRGHHQPFQRHRAAALEAHLAGEVEKACGLQDVIRQRAAAQGIAVGVIDRGARAVRSGLRQYLQPRVELGDQRRAPRLLAQHARHLRDAVARVVQRIGRGELHHIDPDAAQHLDRGARGIGPGEHQIGPQQIDLLGAAVIHGIGGCGLGHGRAVRIGGEIRDRDQLPGIGQHHRQLVGAEVDRHDPARSRIGARGATDEGQRHDQSDEVEDPHSPYPRRKGWATDGRTRSEHLIFHPSIPCLGHRCSGLLVRGRDGPFPQTAIAPPRRKNRYPRRAPRPDRVIATAGLLTCGSGLYRAFPSRAVTVA